MRTWTGGFVPATGATSDERRRCGCGTILARDNEEDECSPCQNAAMNRHLAWMRSVTGRELREGRSRRYMRQKLKLWEVPLPGLPDALEPARLQRVVYHWAKSGSPERTAESCNLTVADVIAALRGEAAEEMIELMIEEGSWPEGAPTLPG